jgi:hypothetical protein
MCEETGGTHQSGQSGFESSIEGHAKVINFGQCAWIHILVPGGPAIATEHGKGDDKLRKSAMPVGAGVEDGMAHIIKGFFQWPRPGCFIALPSSGPGLLEI